MKLIDKKGFSLLELVIVITIVGLLSSIILQSVADSRARAYDSKVKQQLFHFLTVAEIYFTKQDPSSYGPASASCAGGIFNDFNPENGTPGIYIAEGNLPVGTQVFCKSSDSAYAVKATLYSGDKYWCVDSKGASRMIEGTIEGPSTFCP